MNRIVHVDPFAQQREYPAVQDQFDSLWLALDALLKNQPLPSETQAMLHLVLAIYYRQRERVPTKPSQKPQLL
jgi:hypothetical protein